MNQSLQTESIDQVGLLIANEWRAGSDGRTIDVLNPATGKSCAKVSHATTEDLDAALAAAQDGFVAWQRTPASERSRIMRDAAGLLRKRVDTVAPQLTREQGKPLAEARAELLFSATILEWFAEEAPRVYGRVVPARDLAAQQFVYKEAVGPVAAFTPWNFPVSQIVRKLGAALAAGCSFLVKAPEETPASAAALLQAVVDAGAPAGAVGLVFGDPAHISSHLVAHPIIRKVTFTGSTAVGKHLAALAGQHMKRVTMELGGHAPVLVLDDADVQLAAKICAGAKFRNAGQVCISPSRFLVHESIRQEFIDAFVKQTSNIIVGNGLDTDVTMGPLANHRRVAAVAQLVDNAVSKGASLQTGGNRIGTEGNFYQPTLLSDVPLDAAIFNEEPFGPVAAVRSFSSLDEALNEANRLPYGLAAYAFTTSIANAHRVSRELQAGMIWINQPATPNPELPFGGVKDSGFGSEGGPEAVEAYLNTKTVSITSHF